MLSYIRRSDEKQRWLIASTLLNAVLAASKTGLGFKPMKKSETGDCADCHFPMLSLKMHKEDKELDVAMKEKNDYVEQDIYENY